MGVCHLLFQYLQTPTSSKALSESLQFNMNVMDVQDVACGVSKQSAAALFASGAFLPAMQDRGG